MAIALFTFDGSSGYMLQVAMYAVGDVPLTGRASAHVALTVHQAPLMVGSIDVLLVVHEEPMPPERPTPLHAQLGFELNLKGKC